MYTKGVIENEAHCMKVMEKMEEAYQKRDEAYFVKVLNKESSLVLRVHAVCILAEVGGENSMETLADVLLHDADPLVRHEAAFSLGQIGLSEGNGPLERAVMTDPEAIVRHEAAAALGSIGNPSAERVLRLALEDRDEIVRNSARTSLFNLDFLKRYSVGRTTARERAPRP
ncbi:MAG: HEAT repeat domain-containing protein [Thaumarchaeota archaeon]|nr:MAG: HEAT repeat domain-containing protein [Nitrososphaerota archaeon]